MFEYVLCFFQAEDEGVALTVAAYLDEETHIPTPRLLIFLAALLLFTTSLQTCRLSSIVCILYLIIGCRSINFFNRD